MSTDTYRETLDYWTEFNLSERRKSLDLQATTLAEAQEQTVSSRKNLSESTRQFKRLDDGGRLQEIGSLLKMYQKQVDGVTRRAKDAEKAFLTLYQMLGKAPDPVHALEVGLGAEKLPELEAEKVRLEEKLSEYKEEIEEVRNQDVTLRNMEERIRQYEAEMEQNIEQRVAEREIELKDELAAAYTALKAREQELEAHFKAVDIAIQGAQQSREGAQKQLLELKSTLDEERAAKQHERDLMAEGTIESRVEEVVETLLRERHLLSVSAVPATPIAEDIDDTIVSLRAQLKQQEALADALQDQLIEEQEQVARRIEAIQGERSRLESRCTAQDETIDSLRVQLSECPSPATFSELENRLKTLQATVVDAVDSDMQPKTDGDTTLESLLMQKNRKLGLELTKVRQELAEANALLSVAREAVDQEKDTNTSLKALIAKLEDDLSSSAVPTTDQPVVDDQSDLLRIVTSQRDRFRARVEDVEASLFALKREIGDKDRQITQLQEDNVKLFEKIRYVQSYNEHGDVETAHADGTEARYRGMYEERMNPFAVFSKQERNRRYTQLGATDKVTLRVGEFLLSRKPIRTFIFFYALLLHVLVFFTLYYVAHFRCPNVGPVDSLD